MTTLLLIDGHSQAYRAFFGVKTPLSTRSGEPTAAVYGFTRKLLSILREVKPDCVAAAFDTGDTWRHAEFPDYKATRDAMPDEMRSQMARIEQLLDVFSIPVITYSNFEADDVLGTLARQAAAEGTDVLILSGDRDMFQLISDHVKILYTKGGPNPETVVYGPEELEERYELSAEQFVDLKALTGDTSDNIPGVAGVGEKTAIKFLRQYGSVDNLYAHIDEVSGPKTRQNLIEAEALVRRNLRLMSIVTDLDVTYDEAACRLQGFDRDAVVEFFQELEFRSLMRELPATDSLPEDDGDSGQMTLFADDVKTDLVIPAPPGAEAYQLIQDEDALSRLADELRKADLLSFDVETTSTDAMQADLVGLGIAWRPEQAAYVPIGHTKGTQLSWEQVLNTIQPFFADEQIPKVAHNTKYDLTVCRRHGLEIAGDLHDTMVMAWVLDPASRSLGLKARASIELGWQMTELTDLIGSGRKQITMDQVAIEPAGLYCCADVDATIRLFDILKTRLTDTEMWRLYETIEQPLVAVLTDMEMAGVLLDVPFLHEMSEQLASRLMELETELVQLVGHDFNLRSTQQLSQILFEEMSFPTKGMKRTSSGFYSTAVSSLEQLAAQAESLTDKQIRILEIIFEQRQLEKLRGTYVDALPSLVHPETGRVHTSFNQAGAVTGRMSSSNPNLQNIPIRTDIGRRIRRAFIAPEAWSLLSADYSQVELRVLAHVAEEESLIESFQADQDIHAATASRLFGVPIEEVDRKRRGLGKTINFATIYGVSEFGLSSRTEMSRDEARHFLEQYFVTHPRVKQYIDDTIEQARAQGYVETLLGRKRYFPELQGGRLPYNQRQAIERAAINAPIQGTAADIMKLAMIHLHKRLQTDGYAARLLLQVHDELVLEVPAAELDDVAALVRDVMSSAYDLVVPLKVDVEVGPNWYNLEPI